MEYLLSILNFAVLAWVIVAVLMRRNHAVHVTMVTLTFAFDMALLLFVELDREAVKQSLGGPGVMMTIHIAIATLLAVLYPWLLFTGGRVSAGAVHTRHRKLATLFLAGRLGLAVTALALVHG